MYTQCPRCETIFRVSAEILRAAGGQVRCGRCGAAFGALARLEERPDDFPPAGSPLDQDRRAEQILESGTDMDEPDPAAEDFGANASSDPGSGERIERLRIVGPPFFADDESLEFTVPPGDLDRVFIAPKRVIQPMPDESTAPEEANPETPPSEDVEFEAIVIDAAFELPSTAGLDLPADATPEPATALEPAATFEPEATFDPEAARTPETSPASDVTSGSEAAPDPEAASEPEEPAAPEASVASEASVVPEAAPGSAAAADAALLAAATRAAAQPLALDRPKRRTAVAVWSALATVLFLLFAAQIVNRERELIVTRTPFGEPLRALYARLGLPLPIPADLHDYQLRQWGVTGNPAAHGILRVRASILNTAAAFQPYPWLRVTLTDRFGNRVGTRDFAPREYLGKPPKLMAPGERADATLNIVDPGKNAEGFEIDLCLRGVSGAMLCDTGGS